MEIKELMSKFEVSTMLQAHDQFKKSPQYIYDTYFTNQEGILGQSVEVKILRGAGIILSSTSPEAEHLIQKTDKEFIVPISLPRYPLKAIINASELNTLKSFDNEAGALESLADRIGYEVKKHNESLKTTLEYMCAGALFGKVLDGDGKVLFEINNKSQATKMDNTKKIIEFINEYEKRLSDEFGYLPNYEVLSSLEFIDALNQKALSENLFQQNNARWINEENKRILEVYGIKFIPYHATYKNASGVSKKYLDDGAIVVPKNTDAFKLIYGRANHTEALEHAPTMIFTSSPKELDDGRGWAIYSEMRALPVCVRPEALIKLSTK